MKKIVWILIPLVVFVLYTGGANHLTYDGFVTAANNVKNSDALQTTLAEYQYISNVIKYYDTKKSQTTVTDVGAMYLVDDATQTGNILISIDMFGAIPNYLYELDWSHKGTTEATWYEEIGQGVKMVVQVAVGGFSLAGNLLLVPLEMSYDIIESIMYLLGYIDIQ